MPQLVLPLKDNKFSIEVCFNKLGAGNKNKTSVNAIVDTGATHTCISHSIVQTLQIPPSGEFSPTNTASGMVFNRKFPVHIAVGQTLVTSIPALVLFHPEHFLDVRAHVGGTVPHAEIQNQCRLLGIPAPDIVYQTTQSTPDPTGIYATKVFRPGLGAEQNPVLIGMDVLQQYDWSYTKAGRELVIKW